MSYRIPVSNYSAFRANFDRIARRAAKLGLAIPLAGVLRTFVEKVPRANPYTGNVDKILVTFHEVEVSGPRVQLAGWEFIGRLDFATAAPAVLRMMLPGEVCPVEFHNVAPGRCDHCNQIRRRNDSFILRHESGELKIVGRSCLADFLGHPSPEHLANGASCLAQLAGVAEQASLEDWDGGNEGGAPRYEWDPCEILALAVHTIREDGWRPSVEDHRSTRSIVSGMLGMSRKARAELLTDEDHAKAAKVREWALGVEVNDRTSDYLSNLRGVLSNAVTGRGIGIAVSAVVAYDREQERAIRMEREPAANSHAGAVGEKLSVSATITLLKHLDSTYGTTTLVKFLADSGHALTWFASGSKVFDVGSRVALRGTVKKLDAYQGEMTTVLTRCKVEAIGPRR